MGLEAAGKEACGERQADEQQEKCRKSKAAKGMKGARGEDGVPTEHRLILVEVAGIPAG
jgi:hypothetical protein